jgi:hypothetical protein
VLLLKKNNFAEWLGDFIRAVILQEGFMNMKVMIFSELKEYCGASGVFLRFLQDIRLPDTKEIALFGTLRLYPASLQG